MILWLLNCLTIVLLTGCSSFNRAWREASKTPVPTNSMLGRWEGRWVSSSNGHNGALRCIILPTTNDIAEAHFWATYLKVARFSYSVPLQVTDSNGTWHFRGQENLGAMAGGNYQYEGSATATNFDATYSSKHDGGVFQMRRPK